MPDDQLALQGRWRIDESSATAVPDARPKVAFGAKRVFLVLGAGGDKPRRVRVLLDGRPLRDELAGRDVRRGTLLVDRQRLYGLVELPEAERHLLTLEPAPGVSGSAFTFG